MSKGKKRKEDDLGLPKGWPRWTNPRRVNWLRNFRDHLRADSDAMARRYELASAKLQQLDMAQMETVVPIGRSRGN